MVQPDMMKEDGCHQNIPFTEPANSKLQEIVLKMKSIGMIRTDVMSRGGRSVHSTTAGLARLGNV